MTRLSAQQEIVAANARATSKQYGQDKTHPFLINIDDGRLVPNVERIRKTRASKYRIYAGDPKASLEERMAYLRTGVGQPGRAKVVYTQPEEAFDIGKASKEDLLAFAASEYGYAMDSGKSLKVLRDEFAKFMAATADTDLS